MNYPQLLVLGTNFIFLLLWKEFSYLLAGDIGKYVHSVGCVKVRNSNITMSLKRMTIQTDTLILVAVDQLSYQFNTNKLSAEHYTLCKSSWARVQ